MERSQRTLSSLREDTKLAPFLWEQAIAEAKLGRATMPVAASEVDLGKVLLSARFGVEQTKDDGSIKARLYRAVQFWSSSRSPRCEVRGVDDFTASGCNLACRPCEKLVCDNIDSLYEIASVRVVSRLCIPRLGLSGAQVLAKDTDAEMGLWKADIDAAYRRVPLHAEDHWAAGVVWIHEGRVVVAFHKATGHFACAARRPRLPFWQSAPIRCDRKCARLGQTSRGHHRNCTVVAPAPRGALRR